MAQNITLLGATYNDVPAVDLPKSGGGTARFIDITESGTPVYDGTTTSDTKYDALFLETLASGVNTVKVGLDMDLLWTNSSPTSSFASQTISIDTTPYKFLVITLAYSTTTDNESVYWMINNATYNLYWGANRNYRRRVTKTDSGLEFETCQYFGTYGNSTGTTSNTNLIPVEIYGIR